MCKMILELSLNKMQSTMQVRRCQSQFETKYNFDLNVESNVIQRDDPNQIDLFPVRIRKSAKKRWLRKCQNELACQKCNI